MRPYYRSPIALRILRSRTLRARALRARTLRAFCFSLSALLLMIGLLSPALPVQAAVSGGESGPKGPAGPQAPVFVPNAGQTDSRVRFESYAMGGTVFFTPQEVVLALPGEPETQALNLNGASTAQAAKEDHASRTMQVARVKFEGAKSGVSISAEEPVPGVLNIIQGSDPAKWQLGLKNYGGIVYNGLYSGISLRYEGQANALKGTYQVVAGADPSQIRWSYQGASDLQVDATSGNLKISLVGGKGQLVEHAPQAWQMIDGKRVPVTVSYAISGSKGSATVGFTLGSYNKALPLTIDPILEYSTFMGGTGADRISAVSVNAAGDVFVTGETYSVPFPESSGSLPDNSYPNVFVASMKSDGTKIYRSILGGDNTDQPYSIVTDGGIAHLAGYTFSTNFPLVSSIEGQHGNKDMFVVSLSATGAVTFSTLLGGPGPDEATALALYNDGLNNYLYVTGDTGMYLDSPVCPTPDPLQECYPHGGADIVLAKINLTNHSLAFIKQFGGGYDDQARAMAVDAAGSVYLTGSTISNGIKSNPFPLMGAFQPTYGGGGDAFLIKMDSSGTMQYSSFLGGANTDEAFSMALDSTGSNLYLTGHTLSAPVPTYFPLTGTQSTGWESFVVKVSTSSWAPTGIYLGGNGQDQGNGIALAKDGSLYVAGTTSSTDFLSLNPLNGIVGGQNDAFLIRYTPAFAPVYSTKLGGSSDDYGTGLALDQRGADAVAYVVGYTNSSNFPTTSTASQAALSGGDDGFIARIANSPKVVDLSGPLTNGIDTTADFIEAGDLVAGSGPVSLASADATVTNTEGVPLTYLEARFVASPAAAGTAIQPPDGTAESLSVTLAADMSGSYDSATGKLHIAAGPNTTLADFQTVLRSLKYNNTSDAPTTSARLVAVEISDGMNTNAPLAYATVNIQASNDKPALTAPPTLTGLKEEQAGALTGLSVADVDAGASGNFDMQLTFNVADTQGAVSAVVTAPVTAVPTNANGINTLTVTGPLNSLNALLASNQVFFTGITDFNGPASVSVTLSDLGNQPTSAALTDEKTIALTVDPVNDPPVVPTAVPTLTMLEDSTGTTVNITTDLGVTDSKDTTSPPAAPGALFEVKTLTPVVSPTLGKVFFDPAASSLTYIPDPDQFGSDTFTYQVCDKGTDKDPLVSACSQQKVNVTITPVNDKPSFTPGSTTLSVTEDSTYSALWTNLNQAGNFVPGPMINEGGQKVLNVLTSVTENAGMFASGPSIDVNGNLSFTLTKDANGTAKFTVRVQDDGGILNGGVDTSDPVEVTLTVTPVNNPPSMPTGKTINLTEGVAGTFNIVTDLGVNDNADLIPPAATGSVVVTPATLLPLPIARIYTDPNPAVNNNPQHGTVTFNTDGSGKYTGDFTFTPTAYYNGPDQFKYEICDNGTPGSACAQQTVSVNIAPVNNPPSFTVQNNPTTLNVNEDSGSYDAPWATNISAGPGETQGLRFEVNIDPQYAAWFTTQPTVDAATGNLKFVLAPNANTNGTPIPIGVRLWDDGSNTPPNKAFSDLVAIINLTINPVNDPPNMPAGKSFDVNEGSAKPLNIVTDLGVNDNADINAPATGGVALLPLPTIDPYTMKITAAPANGTVTITNASTGDLSYQPNNYYYGSDSFTYQVCDNGTPGNACSQQTVTMNVLQVNNPPSFVVQTNPTAISVNEDGNSPSSPANTYDIPWLDPTKFNKGDPNESGQTLHFEVNLNPQDTALFTTQPTVDVATGNLKFVLAPNANTGVTSIPIGVRLWDDGSNTPPSKAFSDPVVTINLTINPVNDAPYFTAPATIMVNENSGLYDAQWADPASLSVGPNNESTQALTGFTIDNNTNAGLFMQGPTITADGKLQFVPTTGVYGSAVLTISLHDDGGTALLGQDTYTKTVTIQVNSINDLSVSVTGTGKQVLPGFGTTFTLEATNPEVTDATHVTFTTTLPGYLSFDSSTSVGCSASGQVITCTIGTVPAGQTSSLVLGVKVSTGLGADQALAFTVDLSADQFDPDLSNNQATGTVNAVLKQLFYFNDFETAAGPEWSDQTRSQTPLQKRTFLGEFNNQSITLTFDTVDPHGAVEVDFDLFIIRSWDGNQTTKWVAPASLELAAAQTEDVPGPDLWEFAEDGTTLIHSTFTNWTPMRQSFPDWYYADRPYATGASETNTLGYPYQYIPVLDSVYHIHKVFNHTNGTLTLTFQDLGLQGMTTYGYFDESWGLDNVKVQLLGQAMPVKVYLPNVTKK